MQLVKAREDREEKVKEKVSSISFCSNGVYHGLYFTDTEGRRLMESLNHMYKKGK